MVEKRGGGTGARNRGRQEIEVSRGWGLPLAVLVVGMFMSVLDTDIVNVAVPTMQNDFGATTDQVQWVATIYTLALGVVVPASGWLGDRFGLDRVYVAALAAFAAGSALCGVAWNLNTLLFFRVLQAIGGGLMPAVAMAMVMRIVPRKRLGAAMGLFGLGVLFAPAIGPTVGGYLVEYVNWRLIFYINIPVGVLGFVAAVVVLPRCPGHAGRRFDLLGFVTIATALFAVLLALSKGAEWGWTSYRALGCFAVGGFAFLIFVLVELSVDEPLLDLGILRYWNYTNSLILISVLLAGIFGAYFYIPYFLQEGEGLGALQAGLVLLGPALLTGAVMPISGRLYDRIGARWPAATGCLIVAWGTYVMHAMTPDTPRSQMAIWMCIRSVGMGLAFMPIMTSSMANIPPELVSRASALNNIVQRVSSAFGLAVMTSVLTTQVAQQYSSRSGLIPAIQPGGARAGMSPLSLVGATQTASLGGAMDDLMLLTAGITAVAMLLCLMLPARPVAAPMVIEGVVLTDEDESSPAAPEPAASRAAAHPPEVAVAG